MTGTVSNPTISPAVRRLATVVSGFVGAVVATGVAGGAASADTPASWETPPDVDPGFVLGVLVGIPVLLFVAITVAVYLPALVRGENVTPGGQGAEDQWLGGRRTAGELAAPDTADSEAGGASGRW